MLIFILFEDKYNYILTIVEELISHLTDVLGPSYLKRGQFKREQNFTILTHKYSVLRLKSNKLIFALPGMKIN